MRMNVCDVHMEGLMLACRMSWVWSSLGHMHVCLLRYVPCISSILSIDALPDAIIIFTLMWFPAVAI